MVWVGGESGVLPYNHGLEVEMNMCPMEFLNKLFDKFGYTADSEGEKNNPVIPPETIADIKKLWEVPGSIKPFLHCEMQMILYLQANNVQILEECDWLQQIDVLGM